MVTPKVKQGGGEEEMTFLAPLGKRKQPTKQEREAFDNLIGNLKKQGMNIKTAEEVGTKVCPTCGLTVSVIKHEDNSKEAFCPVCCKAI